MNTFEKCQFIRNSILTTCISGLVYKEHWGNEMRIEDINNIPEKIKKVFENRGETTKINPNDLSEKEMKDLGFGRWSEESKLMLIPIWLFPFLADEFDSESISGSKYTKLSELDSDYRLGCIAYGVIPKD